MSKAKSELICNYLGFLTLSLTLLIISLKARLFAKILQRLRFEVDLIANSKILLSMQSCRCKLIENSIAARQQLTKIPINQSIVKQVSLQCSGIQSTPGGLLAPRPPTLLPFGLIFLIIELNLICNKNVLDCENISICKRIC